MENTADLRMKIKDMLVERLRLKISPDEIGDDQPLFGDGLGLDSIDVLEVVAGIEKLFGVSIKTQEEGEKVLQNVDTIAQFLIENNISIASE